MRRHTAACYVAEQLEIGCDPLVDIVHFLLHMIEPSLKEIRFVEKIAQTLSPSQAEFPAKEIADKHTGDNGEDEDRDEDTHLEERVFASAVCSRGDLEDAEEVVVLFDKHYQQTLARQSYRHKKQQKKQAGPVPGKPNPKQIVQILQKEPADPSSWNTTSTIKAHSHTHTHTHKCLKTQRLTNHGGKKCLILSCV